MVCFDVKTLLFVNKKARVFETFRLKAIGLGFKKMVHQKQKGISFSFTNPFWAKLAEPAKALESCAPAPPLASLCDDPS